MVALLAQSRKALCSKQHEQKGRQHPIPTLFISLAASFLLLPPAQLQAQALDVFTAEVNPESQHLPDLGRSEAPGQWARVRAPVIQDLRHLERRDKSCRNHLSTDCPHRRVQMQSRYFPPLTNTHQACGNFSIPYKYDNVRMSPVNPCGVSQGSHNPSVKAGKAHLTLSRLRMVAICESRANLSRIVQVVTVVR